MGREVKRPVKGLVTLFYGLQKTVRPATATAIKPAISIPFQNNFNFGIGPSEATHASSAE